VNAFSDLRDRNTFELRDLWELLRDGRAFVSEATYADGRCIAMVSSRSQAGSAPRSGDVEILGRLLAGEPMKVVAADFGLSLASLSDRCARTLRSMTTQDRVGRSPIILIMAALAARGLQLPSGRVEEQRPDGCVISAEVPSTPLGAPLTPCEAEVWRLILEGKACNEVALARRTSPRTAINQLSSIFRKLGVSGRVALRARAVEEQSRGFVPRVPMNHWRTSTRRLNPTPKGRRTIETTFVDRSEARC
jgi:DNA-binding CsgD family transcriptional regulator